VDRKVSYGRIDPAAARELFVRHALVEGDWQTSHKFFTENRRLLAEAEEVEHRARRRGLPRTWSRASTSTPGGSRLAGPILRC
jgi:ATP-dependent helicase HrpA